MYDTSVANQCNQQITNQSLTKQVMYHSKLPDNLTERCRNEYLLGLREVTSNICHLHVGKLKTLAGDMVILKNEDTKHRFLKICKVAEK